MTAIAQVVLVVLGWADDGRLWVAMAVGKEAPIAV